MDHLADWIWVTHSLIVHSVGRLSIDRLIDWLRDDELLDMCGWYHYNRASVALEHEIFTCHLWRERSCRAVVCLTQASLDDAMDGSVDKLTDWLCDVSLADASLMERPSWLSASLRRLDLDCLQRERVVDWSTDWLIEWSICCWCEDVGWWFPPQLGHPYQAREWMHSSTVSLMCWITADLDGWFIDWLICTNMHQTRILIDDANDDQWSCIDVSVKIRWSLP